MSFVLARDPGFPPTQRMGCAPCSLHDSDGDLHACRISGASAQDRNPGGAVIEEMSRYRSMQDSIERVS